MTSTPPPEGTNRSAKPAKPEHPIASAIDGFVHSARDIRLAGRLFVGTAHIVFRAQMEDARDRLREAANLLESADAASRGRGIQGANKALLVSKRLANAKVPSVLETGLFLSLFSAYDAFTGELLRGLYRRKPALFSSINRALTFSEILAASSLEDVKAAVLDDDIEQFRRKSYVEQFEQLATRFDVRLTSFENWPAFVERAQRRNLITHAGGLVSEQYIAVCTAQGCKSEDLPKVGTRVSLGAKYFIASCELMLEVGFKLGQTLWRKTLPDELEQADEHLIGVIFESLQINNWKRAQMIGAFGVGLPRMFTERQRRILIVNYAQALKWGGDQKGAEQVLAKVDWSATSAEFRLAEVVLLDRFDDAASIMKRIGKEGDMLNEHGYHTWPLFREFRESEQFASAYEAVYGYPYVRKLQQNADAAQQSVAESIEKEEEQAASEVADLSEDSPVVEPTERKTPTLSLDHILDLES